MNLPALWFILIAVLYIGYFVLEGFDLGLGILLPFLGKNDTQRRMMINTIGPHWDGNEVWLITAGGATFAAFPDWYATLFSGFYLPLLLILLALIVRGVAFEFRSKDDNKLWRSVWDWAICIGSFIPALLWGVALSNFVRGVPIDANMQYVGGFWNLLNPYALIGGLVGLAGFILQGALFLSLKIEDPIKTSAEKVAKAVWPVVVALTLIFSVFTYFTIDIVSILGVNPGLIPIAAILTLLITGWFIYQGKTGWAFTLNSVTIALSTATIFLILFPNLMISSLDPEKFSLTIYNSASSPETLQAMSIIALIFVPLVLAYQGYTYWVFRKRITQSPEDLHY
jgi:cytochrome d ubiquinol oxidase subunit II